MTEPPNPARGVLMVLRADPAGLEQFGTTVAAFLSSLAPLVAFPIAGALIELFRTGVKEAAATVAISLIVQLAPPVVSHALAKRWSTEEAWLRYSTAYNWCFWLLPMLASVLTVVFGVAVGLGFPAPLAGSVILIGVGLYALWLHWFLARHGLRISRLRAVWIVLAVKFSTLLLLAIPDQFG